VDTTRASFGNAPWPDLLTGCSASFTASWTGKASQRPVRTSRSTSRAKTGHADHGHVRQPIDVDVVTSDRVQVVDLPAVDRAAVTVHRARWRASRTGIALMRWADETGEQIDGFSREVYLDMAVIRDWLRAAVALQERADRRE
jgi:hypothetical protein